MLLTQAKLIKTIQALVDKINVHSMYCTEKILQELLNKIPINYNANYTSCDAIISSCEYLIADHGKVMLSSNLCLCVHRNQALLYILLDKYAMYSYFK